MKNLPYKIIRLDDGVEFILNKKTNCYRIKYKTKHGISYSSFEYTYERLMCSSDCKGNFKISDGTEDLESLKTSWFSSIKRNNDGHGDDDE